MRNPLKHSPSTEAKPTLRERLTQTKTKAAGIRADADLGRRAVLAGSLAAAMPLPALAASEQPSTGEAAFLALAPKILPLLRRLGPALDESHRLYEAGNAAAGKYPGWTRDDTSAAEAWSARAQATQDANGYSQAWEVGNRLCAAIAKLADPYLDEPMQTLPGILLKASLNEVEECWGESAMADLSRLAAERFGLPAPDPITFSSPDDDDENDEASA